MVERLILYNLGIIVYGILVFVLFYPAKPAKLITVLYERIQIDCFRTICLRAVIIFEIEFRYCPKIVGVIEKRLGIYDFVEILYGKHIIIIIERVAPYEHNPVGVDLCSHRKGQ